MSLISTLRLLFQLAVQYDFDVQQTGVDSALLYYDLQEESYMEQPEGFRRQSSGPCRCNLRKTVYGLK